MAYAFACMTIDDRPSVGVAMFNTQYIRTAEKKYYHNEEL